MVQILATSMLLNRISTNDLKNPPTAVGGISELISLST